MLNNSIVHTHTQATACNSAGEEPVSLIITSVANKRVLSPNTPHKQTDGRTTVGVAQHAVEIDLLAQCFVFNIMAEHDVPVLDGFVCLGTVQPNRFARRRRHGTFSRERIFVSVCACLRKYRSSNN